MSVNLSDELPALPPTLGERYALTRRIGSGGMETVFLARGEKHDRNVGRIGSLG